MNTRSSHPKSSGGRRPAAKKRPSPPSVPADRWLEIDLYWFDKDRIVASVDAFWERFTPLYAGVEGRKGVVLNIGWLMDYILEWKGDLEASIPLPERMCVERYVDPSPLKGTTAQRMEGWKRRFEHVEAIPVVYEKWTYGEIKTLVALLRARVVAQGFPDMRVGSSIVAWRNVYQGEPSRFSRAHPEAYALLCNGQHCFNPASLLNAEPTSYAAFPRGVAEGMPAYKFFAAQWGDLSRTLGLDALVLRDSMLGMGVYGKFGPYGPSGPGTSAELDRCSRATAAMVRAVKRANPEVWLMGYSSGACAVADWRVNCCDLETVAREGYLDAFIDQTWSGAWNEVGQRKETFWNYSTRGWTPQLAFVLLHAAVLADTPVKHYTLTETFDAWEPFDVIHHARDRLRWGIWAYLHAGVKTPAGLKFPAGTYISWSNQGKRLLSESDVKFLAGHTNEAVRDARQTTEIFGPTLVYNRSAIEWQCRHAPSVSIKEWIDEQAGIVMKYSVPILSVTRVEYLPQVRSDLFIFQTPVHLPAKQKKVAAAIIRSGAPVAIWGSPAGGIDTGIGELAGLASDDAAFGPLEYSVSLATRDHELARDIPEEFRIYHQWSNNHVIAHAQVLYRVNGSPALVRNRSGGRDVLTWDPCEYNENVGHYTRPIPPIADIVGSPYPYVLVARSLAQMLRRSHRFSAETVAINRPVTVHAWRLRSGKYCILVADTEEGFDNSAALNRTVTLKLPPDWPVTFTNLRNGRSVEAAEGKLLIRLGRGAEQLYGS